MKKYVALFLVLVTVLSVFAGCGSSSDEIVLPKQNVAETYENRVAAILETAWAYYYKNDSLQYDSHYLCMLGRSAGLRTAEKMNNTPELSSPNRTTYLTCSSYTYHCLYHAFDYSCTEQWWNNTPIFAAHEELQKYISWQYIKEGNETSPEDAMEDFIANLQPGDLIYYYRDRSFYAAGAGDAHATIWLGDYDGDGDDDMIGVDGSYYNAEKMEDIREEGGGVDINTDRWECDSGVAYFTDPSFYDYFPKLRMVTVYRFADEKFVEDMKITERAKTRILYPGLEIYHEAECGVYGSVAQDATLTYTVSITNNSEKDHKGILVQMPTPTNAEIVAVDGAEAKKQVVKWTVDIPAGQTVEHTYTVKPTGAVGDVIVTGTGYVHAIPLPSLNTVIASSKPDAETVKAAIDAAEGKDGEEFLADYLAAMGTEASIPSVKDILSALYDRKNIGQDRVYWPKAPEDIKEEHAALAKMQIPEYFGGQYIGTEPASLRVKELRAQDLQAGDILIWKAEAASEPAVAVCDGESLLWARDGGLLPLEQWRLDEFLMYYFFIALRPTQAY